MIFVVSHKMTAFCSFSIQIIKTHFIYRFHVSTSWCFFSSSLHVGSSPKHSLHHCYCCSTSRKVFTSFCLRPTDQCIINTQWCSLQRGNKRCLKNEKKNTQQSKGLRTLRGCTVIRGIFRGVSQRPLHWLAAKRHHCYNHVIRRRR